MTHKHIIHTNKMSQIVKFIQTDLGYNSPYSLLTISQIEKEQDMSRQIIDKKEENSAMYKFRISNRKPLGSSKR